MELGLGTEALIAAALAIVIACLMYMVDLIVRAECDLTLLGKRLKAGYFSGKVVWVTGASSGIGEALCYELSKHGAKLIMSARSEAKMESIRNNLEHPERVKILPLDLSDPDVCSSATEKALKLFGRVDILINNAGVSQRCFFLDTDEDTYSTIMQLNFLAPRTLMYGVLPGMLSKDFGHIVNISSVYGKYGMPLRTAYCASKYALHGLTDCLRYELHDKNVHLTLVCPGPVKTAVDRNSLIGGGKTFDKTDDVIQQGMPAERFAQMMLVAVSNQLYETWISTKPLLFVPYLAQYAPSLLHAVWMRKASSFIEKTTGRKGY